MFNFCFFHRWTQVKSKTVIPLHLAFHPKLVQWRWGCHCLIALRQHLPRGEVSVRRTRLVRCKPALVQCIQPPSCKVQEVSSAVSRKSGCTENMQYYFLSKAFILNPARFLFHSKKKKNKQNAIRKHYSGSCPSFVLTYLTLKPVIPRETYGLNFCFNKIK